MVGWEVTPVGGPSNCCGYPRESNARISGGMGRRTAENFNASGKEHLVTWCPGCHMNMEEMIAPVTKFNLDTRHISQVLYDNREKLKKFLKVPIELNVMMHLHQGFNDKVPVNSIVPELLGLIPGLRVVAADYLAPGYMCHSLVPVAGAVPDMQRRTLHDMQKEGATALCTIFHSCHPTLVELEQRNPVTVFNWIHLLAQSAGLEAVDMYKRLRNASEPHELISPNVMDTVNPSIFEKLIEPELKRAPRA
jgi:hypothetical protein